MGTEICPECGSKKIEIVTEFEYERQHEAIGDETDCLYCGQLISIRILDEKVVFRNFRHTTQQTAFTNTNPQ